MAGFCLVRRLGSIGYAEATTLQKELVTKVKAATQPPTLLLLEHPPVITIGRKGTETHVTAPPERLRTMGVELFETDRGGDVTFHGPGQLVGYPILKLEGKQKDVHRYLRLLEEVILRVVADYGLYGRRLEGFTGVWLGDRKVAAIGVAISNWVTFHGFALNVNVDLRYFDLIVPCGIRGKGVTSLEQELGREVPMTEVIDRVVAHFSAVFEVECRDREHEEHRAEGSEGKQRR